MKLGSCSWAYDTRKYEHIILSDMKRWYGIMSPLVSSNIKWLLCLPVRMSVSSFRRPVSISVSFSPSLHPYFLFHSRNTVSFSSCLSVSLVFIHIFSYKPLSLIQSFLCLSLFICLSLILTFLSPKDICSLLFALHRCLTGFFFFACRGQQLFPYIESYSSLRTIANTSLILEGQIFVTNFTGSELITSGGCFVLRGGTHWDYGIESPA